MATDNTEYIKHLFTTWQQSRDEESRNALLIAIHDDLHRMASALLRRHLPGAYTRTTELANDFIEQRFLKFTDLDWRSRAEFYGLLSRAMRNFLVDQVRALAGRVQVALPSELGSPTVDPLSIRSYHETVEKLAAVKPHWGLLLDWRLLCGLDWKEIEQLAAAHNDFAALKRKDLEGLKGELRKAIAWARHRIHASRASKSVQA